MPSSMKNTNHGMTAPIAHVAAIEPQILREMADGGHRHDDRERHETDRDRHPERRREVVGQTPRRRVHGEDVGPIRRTTAEERERFGETDRRQHRDRDQRGRGDRDHSPCTRTDQQDQRDRREHEEELRLHEEDEREDRAEQQEAPELAVAVRDDEWLEHRDQHDRELRAGVPTRRQRTDEEDGGEKADRHIGEIERPRPCGVRQ